MKLINLKALFAAALFSTLVQASQSPQTPRTPASTQGSPVAMEIAAAATPSPVQNGNDGGAAAAAAAVQAPANQVPLTPNIAQLNAEVDGLMDEDEALLPITNAQELAQAAALMAALAQAHVQPAQAHDADGNVVYNMAGDMKNNEQSPKE